MTGAARARLLALALGSLGWLNAARAYAQEPPVGDVPPQQDHPVKAPPKPIEERSMTVVGKSPPAPAMEPPPPPLLEPAPATTTEKPLFAKEGPQRPPPRPVNTTPEVVKNAPPPLIWKWRTFGAADFVVAGIGGGITLTSAIVRPRAKHSLSGGLWFDESVRDALRAKTLTTRYTFRDASDVGLSLAVSWPFAADALTAGWWYRGSRESAQEMALIDLETLAVSGAIQGVTNVLVSRERPYGRTCGTSELPSDSLDCTGSIHYRSFFSGHSAFSFTGAALICIHHYENDLLGAPWDALSCAGGYAVAATTATFRIVSDVHYASDVLTGALLGTLVGYGVPLLHYGYIAKPSATSAGLQLHLIPAPNGLGLLGVF
jgi:membrane-associated phospholipid phosphatase